MVVPESLNSTGQISLGELSNGITLFEFTLIEGSGLPFGIHQFIYY